MLLRLSNHARFFNLNCEHALALDKSQLFGIYWESPEDIAQETLEFLKQIYRYYRPKKDGTHAFYRFHPNGDKQKRLSMGHYSVFCPKDPWNAIIGAVVFKSAGIDR